MVTYSVLFLRNKDPKAFIAKAIRDIEGLSWNHVEILRRDDSTGEAISYGSVYPYSRKIPLEQLKERYEVEFEVYLNPKEDVRICDLKLETMLNKPYSQLQIFLIGLSLFCQSWIPFVKPNLTDKLICVELLGEFLIDCCHIKLPKSQEMLTLRDVWYLLT